MRNRTQPSLRIYGVVLILIIGFIGTLAALAEQDTKESDIQISPRRETETTAAYNRRVSVARNASAARRRALTAQDAKAPEIQIPPRRQDETAAAYNRRVSVARNAAARSRNAAARSRALTAQDAKASEIQIPPRRQDETAAAYNRRVSVARSACAARRRASDQMPKMYDKQTGETDTSYQKRLRRTVMGLLSLQTPNASHRIGENQVACQARRRSSAPTEYAFLVARPGEEETAYMSRLTAWKGLRENTKRRSGKTEAIFKARLRAKAARLRAKAASLDSEIARADVDLLTEQERAVVDLPFETSLSAGGVSASRRTYCNGNYGISDIGPLSVGRRVKCSGSFLEGVTYRVNEPQKSGTFEISFLLMN
jgi:hypothetical protein